MAKRFYTILILPDATSKARKLHITRPALAVASCLVGFVLTLFFFSVYEYITLHSSLLELRHLRRQVGEQQQWLDQIQGIQNELNRLRDLDHKFRTVAGLKGVREQLPGMGGAAKESQVALLEALKTGKGSLAEAMSRELEQLSREVQARARSFRELKTSLEERRLLLKATPTIWPVNGWLTSGYGRRLSPFTGRQERHEGLDIAAPTGTPIVATADGVVAFSGKLAGHGNVVFLEHDHGFSTFYAHNSRNAVSEGERVKRGQVIAYVGDTGYTTGAHLHYGVQRNGTWVDPQQYIVEDKLPGFGEGQGDGLSLENWIAAISKKNR